MIQKKLPAKDVPIGATVKVLDDTPVGPSELEVTIADRLEHFPIDSMMVWRTELGLQVYIQMELEVEVVSIPEATA